MGILSNFFLTDHLSGPATLSNPRGFENIGGSLPRLVAGASSSSSASSGRYGGGARHTTSFDMAEKALAQGADKTENGDEPINVDLAKVNKERQENNALHQREVDKETKTGKRSEIIAGTKRDDPGWVAEEKKLAETEASGAIML